MCKMSCVLVALTVLLLVVCVDAVAASKRKQVSTTLKMTAQRNDTGIWTAQFGDYEMVIEHRHFGKQSESSKQQDGSWTMKLKHTVTVFPDEEDTNHVFEENNCPPKLKATHQKPSWADERNETKPSENIAQRDLENIEAMLNASKKFISNSKRPRENVMSSAIATSVDAPQHSANLLPDFAQTPSPTYMESEEESVFEDQGGPEVSLVPRFEALRSPSPEDDANIESAQPHKIIGTPVGLHQGENSRALDDNPTFNVDESMRMPTPPQRVYQQPEEVIERTVGIPQRRVQGNPEDEVREPRKKVTVNQALVPTDTQLEVPLNRGDPSIWRNPSPWPILTSTYESQQRPMTSDVAYDDVEAESAAAAGQEEEEEEEDEDEDDLALAHEKKLVMERYPRSRSLPPYNMGYEHYPGVGWLKLNTSYWQWPEARKACEAEGAHLAVPNTERKVRIFLEIMTRHSYVVERAVLKNQVYVGVYTPDRYRRFTTVLGEPFHPDFPIWFDNEPNNADPGEECVTLHVMGRIRDVPCFYNLPFLCEIREH